MTLLRLGKRLSRRAARRETAAARPESPGVDNADADDHAHYSCVCGHSFVAGVTASVRCPRCGAAQPW